jgi:hypothetical protein
LRLSYTPTWGSHGATRQAGPLPQDTKDQITEKKPGKNSIDLVDKKISYDAQQRSLENQLKAVQQKKEEWMKIQMAKDAKTKGYNKPELDNKWIEAENKFLESSSQLAMGSEGIPLDPRENQFCPKMNCCQQRLLRHVHVVVVDVKPIHVVDGVNLMTCCLNSQIQTAHHVCTLGWLWLQRSAQVEPVLGQIDQKVASFAPCKGNFHLRRHIGQNHPAATHVNHRAKLGESFDAHKIGTFSASMVYMPRWTN